MTTAATSALALGSQASEIRERWSESQFVLLKVNVLCFSICTTGNAIRTTC
jgi:hypothetical protein